LNIRDPIYTPARPWGIDYQLVVLWRLGARPLVAMALGLFAAAVLAAAASLAAHVWLNCPIEPVPSPTPPPTPTPNNLLQVSGCLLPL